MSMDKEESNAGKIVGAVLGTIVTLIVASSIAVLLYCLFIKRKNRVDDEKHVISSDIVEEDNKIIVPEVKEYYLNHKNDIVTQFNDCRLNFGYSQATACLLENTNKNRSQNILPYDHNRVVLNYEHDYINASFVQTYGTLSNVCFIAAQGPKHETAEDFWRMTWDNNVKIVVMLSKCYEHDKEMCHQYWPNEGSMEIGDFVIKSHEKEESLNFIKTTFKVMRNDEERQIYHFSYISWMDNTAPENIFSLLNLREKVLSLIDQESENTIVVHCSDGAGRTGTFIALDYLLRQAEQEGCVDFCECLNFLRNQRCNMIQSLSQYELCFRAIAMFHMLGKSTFISTEDCNVFKNKMKKLTDEMIQKQFDIIDEEVSVKKAVATANVVINCSSNPIEAVLTPSSQKSSSYAIGVMPSASVVEDLFEIFDGNCSMLILLDNEDLTNLPNDDQQILHKNGSIQLTETNDCDFYKKYSFKIDKEREFTNENTDLSDHSDANVVLNAFLLHVSKDVSKSFDDLAQLYSVVKPVFDHTDKPGVTVLSRSGYKDAGFLVAAFNIMQMIDISKEVDVYETVFELRNVQPEIMNDFNLFKNLYSFVNHITNKTSEILNSEFLPVKGDQPETAE